MKGPVLHLHGLLPTQTRRRKSDTAHRLVRFGPLTGLISRCPFQGKLETADDAAARVLVHHQLLSFYAAHGPVLPMQFGAYFSSLRAIRSQLAAQEHAHLATLSRLGHRQEYSLSVTRTDAPANQSLDSANVVSGREFLSRRRAKRDQRGVARAEQLVLCDEILTAWRDVAPVSLHPSRKALLTASILLAPDQRAAIEVLLSQQATALAAVGLGLKLSGPWPPYGFVAPESEAEVAAHGA